MPNAQNPNAEAVDSVRKSWQENKKCGDIDEEPDRTPKNPALRAYPQNRLGKMKTSLPPIGRIIQAMLANHRAIHAGYAFTGDNPRPIFLVSRLQPNYVFA